MAKQTAKQVVAANLAEIQKMTTAKELFEFSRAQGFDSAAGFSAFKKALLSAGIDYEAIRTAGREARQADLKSKVNYCLSLFSDAKASHRRFAICDEQGEAVWFGRFFDDDRDFDGEQSSGEMAAAKKAVWLAAKVAAALGESVIDLTLRVDAEWLTWANEAAAPDANSKVGGKARQLADLARKLNVLLTVVHIAGDENPADRWTTASGYKKWSDNDLTKLAYKIEKAQI